MEIFRLQEPVSVELLTKKKIQYQEEVLKNNEELMQELEKQVRELQMKNLELENHIKYSNMNDEEFQRVMQEYDSLIATVWAERQVLMYENSTLRNHAGYLETSFGLLLDKYEEAKNIVQEFERNEGMLKRELRLYNTVVKKLQDNINLFKEYPQCRAAAEAKKLAEKAPKPKTKTKVVLI